jgi:hypothetical protein
MSAVLSKPRAGGGGVGFHEICAKPVKLKLTRAINV